MVPFLCDMEVDHVLPEVADVVIIGGGIIGASAALFLAKSGKRVVVCDKGEIGAEQSGRNQGWVRTTNRDPSEIPLAIESARMWADMERLVGRETGYRRAGLVFFAETEAKMADREAWMDKAREYQLDARLLTSKQVSEVFPGLKRVPLGALQANNDGRAEPQLATRAIAAAAREAGAVFLSHCSVLDLERSAGRISGVVTERGLVRCDSVVVAAGAWSSMFLRMFGIKLPQLKIRSSVMKIYGVEGGPETGISTTNFLARKRLDGGYTIAHTANHIAEIVPDSFRYFSAFLPVLRRRWDEVPLNFGKQFFEELGHTRKAITSGKLFAHNRILDPFPNEKQSLKALEQVRQTLPGFENARVIQHWGGMVDVTPDEVPVISAAEKIPGMVIATGFSGHGFGIGPGAGRLVADLVTGTQPIVDPTPFALKRFSEGSWKTTTATR